MHTDETKWPTQPRFALSVREITSVSATFLLAGTPSGSTSDFSWSDDDDGSASGSDDGLGVTVGRSNGRDGTGSRVVAEALAKGLTVLVNSQPWQRVLMRVDDRADEAVVIIYGLMPGRQYDIELGVAPGTESVRGQVTTEFRPHATEQSRDNSAHLQDSSDDEPAPEFAPSPASSPPSSPPPVPAQPTLEERAAQLQHTLSQLDDERGALAGALKAARRDAQKADAALRAEIEVLRRAAEKQAAAEARARQKLRALQEAARQAAAATADAHDRAREVEDALPTLRARREDAERECADVRAEADKAREARDEAERAARRSAEATKAELAGLSARLEKLGTKKEKMESGTISDLEAQLAQLQADVELAERDSYGLLGLDGAGDGSVEIDEVLDTDPTVSRAPAFAPQSPRRRQYTPAYPVRSIIGRPGPIQRPAAAAASTSVQHPHMHPHPHAVPHQHTHAPLHTHAHSHSHQQQLAHPRHPLAHHQHHSLSHTMAPIASASGTAAGPRQPIHSNTFPPLSGKTVERPLAADAAGGPLATTSSSSSPGSSSSGAGASVPSSTLSGRAPPFEPRRAGAAAAAAVASTSGRTTELNPASSPFEPRIILTNPNKGRAVGGK